MYSLLLLLLAAFSQLQVYRPQDQQINQADGTRRCWWYWATDADIDAAATGLARQSLRASTHRQSDRQNERQTDRGIDRETAAATNLKRYPAVRHQSVVAAQLEVASCRATRQGTNQLYPQVCACVCVCKVYVCVCEVCLSLSVFGMCPKFLESEALTWQLEMPARDKHQTTATTTTLQKQLQVTATTTAAIAAAATWLVACVEHEKPF